MLKTEIEVRIHTGHWGCGAYGGNKSLMAILQIIAAEAAGVRLMYHTLDQEGEQAVKNGIRILHEMLRNIRAGKEGQRRPPPASEPDTTTNTDNPNKKKV